MSQNAQIPTPASKNLKTAKNPPKKYPIVKINRHKKTIIRELAYSASNSYLTPPNKTLCEVAYL